MECRGLSVFLCSERHEQERGLEREKKRKQRNAARKRKRTKVIQADFSDAVLLTWTVVYQSGTPGKYPFWWRRDISVPDLLVTCRKFEIESCYLAYRDSNVRSERAFYSDLVSSTYMSAFAEAYEIVTGKRLYDGTNRIVEFSWRGEHIATMHHDNILVLYDISGRPRGIARAKYRRPKD